MLAIFNVAFPVFGLIFVGFWWWMGGWCSSVPDGSLLIVRALSRASLAPTGVRLCGSKACPRRRQSNQHQIHSSKEPPWMLAIFNVAFPVFGLIFVGFWWWMGG